MFMSFFHCCSPVHKGYIFIVRAATRTRLVEFKVLEKEPESFGIVGPDTEMRCRGDLLVADDEESASEKNPTGDALTEELDAPNDLLVADDSSVVILSPAKMQKLLTVVVDINKNCRSNSYQ